MPISFEQPLCRQWQTDRQTDKQMDRQTRNVVTCPGVLVIHIIHFQKWKDWRSRLLIWPSVTRYIHLSTTATFMMLILSSLQPLSEQHNVFTLSGLPDVTPLAPLPPDYKPLPGKPLFFDLALNHIEFPSLQHRTKQSGGITGFVKDLFWGQ